MLLLFNDLQFMTNKTSAITNERINFCQPSIKYHSGLKFVMNTDGNYIVIFHFLCVHLNVL